MLAGKRAIHLFLVPSGGLCITIMQAGGSCARLGTQDCGSASASLHIESCQELIRDRSPPVRMKSQQMAVARNVLEKFKTRAAAGRGERLIVFADQSFRVEFVVVGIES